MVSLEDLKFEDKNWGQEDTRLIQESNCTSLVSIQPDWAIQLKQCRLQVLNRAEIKQVNPSQVLSAVCIPWP